METPTPSPPQSHPIWPLGRAKARFSEVVRLARSGQPQRVTVHGRDAVVIVAGTEFERLTARDRSPSLRELVAGSPLTRLPERRGGRRRFRAGDE